MQVGGRHPARRVFDICSTNEADFDKGEAVFDLASE